MEAHCGKLERNEKPTYYPDEVTPIIQTHAVPAEFCTCGIYAKDDFKTLHKLGLDQKYSLLLGKNGHADRLYVVDNQTAAQIVA